jgi:CRISPR-associated endonuclease/helicase Cas3
VQKITQAEQSTIKRKAHIVRCDGVVAAEGLPSVQEQYFARMQTTLIKQHQAHHTVDEQTGKRVSFGVVRVANIPPCAALANYLLHAPWPEHISPKIMCYHSRQVLLLRSHQEHHLDEVLKRKEQAGDAPKAFGHKVIREHLDNTPDTVSEVIFILVATPVEEVGRDHDFDWAVIEPSSYRSIIQLAGRVRRHRNMGVTTPNIGIMQYNLKGLRREKNEPVFCHPGYEQNHLHLNQHNMDGLVDEAQLNHAVNAIPRIEQPTALDPHNRLVDLEHQAIANSLTRYTQKGPATLQAWLVESWWLTGLPQTINRFRNSTPDVSLYRVWQNGQAIFAEKDDRGKFLKDNMGNLAPCGWQLNISEREPLGDEAKKRLWLPRDYKTVLQAHCNSKEHQNLSTEDQLRRASQRYGEITVPKPKKDREQKFEYSDDFGLVAKR